MCSSFSPKFLWTPLHKLLSIWPYILHNFTSVTNLFLLLGQSQEKLALGLHSRKKNSLSLTQPYSKPLPKAPWAIPSLPDGLLDFLTHSLAEANMLFRPKKCYFWKRILILLLTIAIFAHSPLKYSPGIFFWGGVWGGVNHRVLKSNDDSLLIFLHHRKGPSLLIFGLHSSHRNINTCKLYSFVKIKGCNVGKSLNIVSDKY